MYQCINNCSNSLGMALVAGKNRVPRRTAGKIALWNLVLRYLFYYFSE